MQTLLQSNDTAVELDWLHGLRQGAWGLQAVERDPARQLETFGVLEMTPQGRKTQSMYALGHLQTLAQHLRGKADCYVSQASFIGARRTKSLFSRVRACWVDLDLYQAGLRFDAALAREIRAHCRALQLPEPSLIIASGRGAYCKWMLTRPTTNLPAWDAAQSMLTLLFRRFVADVRARDACRVFRPLGSTNSKAQGAVVHVVDGSGQEVDFESLALALEQARQETAVPAQLRAEGVRGPQSRTIRRWCEDLAAAAERGSAEELALYAQLRQPIMAEGGKKTSASLGWARFCDLRDLFVRRGGIPVGQRDLALFWMLNSLAHAGVVRSCNWQHEIEMLLRAFPRVGRDFDPLQDGSMQSLRQRLINTERLREQVQRVLKESATSGQAAELPLVKTDELLYRPSNQHLIEVFGITAEEQRGLSTLIDAQERQRRRDEKAPGRAERRQRREQLRQRVQQWLQDHGWVCDNVSALARELGEAVGRVWRVVKALLQQRHSAEECAAGDRPGRESNESVAVASVAAMATADGLNRDKNRDNLGSKEGAQGAGLSPSQGSSRRRARLAGGRIVSALEFLSGLWPGRVFKKRRSQAAGRDNATPAKGVTQKGRPRRAGPQGPDGRRQSAAPPTGASIWPLTVLATPQDRQAVVERARRLHERARQIIAQAHQAPMRRLEGSLQRLRQRLAQATTSRGAACHEHLATG